ncbi:UDP-N-acetylmuramoyl-L-alanine--D-glutamate ligase [Candidatus Giovannonibacteria bacterium]|nr:UDP-N-acetylmuramoyl-L-alanine--D-glutamate ligase [Candidatus Giovannonibacteria bacterium]
MKKVAIIGYGLEGKSLLSFLKKDRSLDITILADDKGAKIPQGVKRVLGKKYLEGLSSFDIIYRSPGVPFRLSQIQENKSKVSSLTNLFFEIAKAKKAKIIGITGSSGKTTTATLLYKILKNGGKKVFMAGNIGVNGLGFLNKLDSKSFVVMELSSFQLQDLKQSPEVAIILDIYEEHLDKHKDFSEYLGAKSNIVKRQDHSDAVIYFSDNKFSKALALKSKGRKIPLLGRDWESINYKLRLPGKYNQRNVMAARLSAKYLGIRENIIKRTSESFKGLPHRVEFVRKINGVSYYDNSKGTNIGSAIAGIDTFPEKKIVLAGGYSKNLDFSPLVKRLLRNDVIEAIFFGASKNELINISKKAGLKKIRSVNKMKEAVKMAAKIAKSGTVVLLSPGTASFDEFKNYEERGEIFKSLVKKIR